MGSMKKGIMKGRGSRHAPVREILAKAGGKCKDEKHGVQDELNHGEKEGLESSEKDATE